MPKPIDPPSMQDDECQLRAFQERSDLVEKLKSHEETIARQRRQIDQQTAELAHSRKIFDRASQAARIGVWECTLPDDSLHWTDAVYDLFDLPRGSPLHRSSIVECYTEQSARELEHLRSRAIAERTGFEMDAAIVTAKGNRRWIRINAVVESENGKAVRIFGMKQDVTETKILLEKTRYLAEYDVMTGLANRSLFQSMMNGAGTPGPNGRSVGALLVVDLDGFKQINDSFGHLIGDECLKLAARRLQGICDDARLVARIGGDEFAVLVLQRERAFIALLAQRIVDALSAPYEIGGRKLSLGASVGAALTDPTRPARLFADADVALYAAKNAGRNTFRLHSRDLDRPCHVGRIA